jgi:hypothetical protein
MTDTRNQTSAMAAVDPPPFDLGADAESWGSIGHVLYEALVGKLTSRAEVTADSILSGTFDELGGLRGELLNAEFRGELDGAIEMLSLACPTGDDVEEAEVLWRQAAHREAQRRVAD